MLLAVARHLDDASDLSSFLAGLTATIASLVQGRRVAFWLLDPERQLLSAQPGAQGFPDDILEAMQHIPCRPGGEDPADLIVHHGLHLGPANLDEARFAPYRRWLDVMGVHDAIATAWRAGDQPLGILVAYDSARSGGFEEEDMLVLRIAALAAGLVWQHKRAEQALERLRIAEATRLQARVDEVSELDRLKSHFLRLASHELRGPITVLHGYLDMLTKGALGEVSDEIRSVHTLLAAKTDHVNRLVDQMLDTARLDDHRLVLTLSDFDLRDVAREAVEEHGSLIGAGHRLVLDGPEGAIVVRGDRSRILAIVANLIGNAIKYSPDGGEISVSCADDAASGWASVTITDHGMGIDEADLPRVFTRFGRIVTADNSHIPGTGLGLFLSREIARMHGGDVTMSSSRGEGTTVTVTLPLIPDLLPAAASLSG